MQNGIHLLGDRHLDATSASQSDRSLGGEDAFRDRPVHAGDDVRQFAAAAQFDAYAAIARESAGAGEHQVAQAGESGHGFLAAAAGHGQPRDLSQAAGDESGNGIVAESQSVAHSGRDGDNVFQRSAEFNSDHIVVGVKPEAGIAEFALHRFRQLRILRGHRDGGRIAACHFLGERRSAQRSDARRKPTSQIR